VLAETHHHATMTDVAGAVAATGVAAGVDSAGWNPQAAVVGVATQKATEPNPPPLYSRFEADFLAARFEASTCLSFQTAARQQSGCPLEKQQQKRAA
jgi:hypothetical protein